MSDLGTLRVWDDTANSAALSWYLDVAENRRPAEFRIAATLCTDIDLATSSEEALWAELDRLTPIFVGRWQEWIAEHPPAAPVNVMAVFHRDCDPTNVKYRDKDNFCDPTNVKYRDKYAEIARRATHGELDASWRRARELGLKFETTTFERPKAFSMPAILET